MYSELKFLRGGIFFGDGKYRHISRVISSSELIIVTEGELCLEISGERIRARSGDVLRILPGEPHGGFDDTDSPSFIWLHFDGAADGEMPNRMTRPKSFDRTLLLAKEVLHYSKSNGYPSGITECILRALLAEICYLGEEDGSLISSIKEWIRKARMRPVSVSEVSVAFGYCGDYLNRLFKSRIGIGLKQYIDSVRLDAIKQELLISGDSLSSISERCGFSDYKYFLKYFKYHAGMSPSEYKETYYKAITN